MLAVATQKVPQAPQWLVSLVRLTHDCPQQSGRLPLHIGLVPQTQAPPAQALAAVALQTIQATPPEPHAVVVVVTHWLLPQHPEQGMGSQTQAPPMHRWPA